MCTVREAIADQVEKLMNDIRILENAAANLPQRVLDVEVTDVVFMSPTWIRVKGDCEQLVGLPSAIKKSELLKYNPRTKVWENKPAYHEMTFVLRNDDRLLLVDLERSKGVCVKARVRYQVETTMELCGEPPEGYEIIEVIGLD